MRLPWIKVAIIGAALAAGYISYLVTQKADGVIEQAAESVLRTQGIDIDLSPE